MPPKREMNPSGLGRAIINRKVKDAKKMQETGNYSVDLETTSKLQSVTQERNLDEFFNTAELAGTEFTAERGNVKIIQQSVSLSQNPYLLTEQEEIAILKKQEAHKRRLRVPRRPPWTKQMTATHLDRQEKAAFLEWRRDLAALQETEGFLLTPFERNIEVWRQLWRVLERSHLIVQIVDARNPLRFRCEDLEVYIRDVEGPEGEAGTGKGKRKSMLLINKSDLLTTQQRCQWADYFVSQGIRYAFFSAASAAALQQARREKNGYTSSKRVEDTAGGDRSGVGLTDLLEQGNLQLQRTPTPPYFDEKDEELDELTSDEDYFSAEDEEFSQDPRARILSVLELEDLLLREAPPLSDFSDPSGKIPLKLTVGLVGYPNVGKSSTINSLLGEKKVSVSSTPGKTKHFQTIHLSDTIVLCDCPGLVFPQFATTKADLICDGVLPIDQMREYTAPITLVVKRIPKEILEVVYGLSIKLRGADEGGDGKIVAQDLLIAYAIARGYMRSGQGNPDEARAARYILKDYVNAKLLFCHPPPDIGEDLFNETARQLRLVRAAGKKKAPVTRVGKDSDTFVVPTAINDLPQGGHGVKSNAVDNDFFGRDSLAARPMIQGRNKATEGFSRATFYPHQNTVADDGTPINFSSARIASVLANSGPAGKNHKKMKRTKQRSGKGYD